MAGGGGVGLGTYYCNVGFIKIWFVDRYIIGCLDDNGHFGNKLPNRFNANMYLPLCLGTRSNFLCQFWDKIIFLNAFVLFEIGNHFQVESFSIHLRHSSFTVLHYFHEAYYPFFINH